MPKLTIQTKKGTVFLDIDLGHYNFEHPTSIKVIYERIAEVIYGDIWTKEEEEGELRCRKCGKELTFIHRLRIYCCKKCDIN